MSVSLVFSSSQNYQINTRKHIYKSPEPSGNHSVYKHQLLPVTTEKLQGLCLLLKPNPETTPRPASLTDAPAQSPEPSGNQQCVQTSAFASDYWEATRPLSAAEAKPRHNPETAASLTDATRTKRRRRRCERGQKRGKRGGIRARLTPLDQCFYHSCYQTFALWHWTLTKWT